jgi:hypothetical protein
VTTDIYNSASEDQGSLRAYISNIPATVAGVKRSFVGGTQAASRIGNPCNSRCNYAMLVYFSFTNIALFMMSIQEDI